MKTNIMKRLSIALMLLVVIVGCKKPELIEPEMNLTIDGVDISGITPHFESPNGVSYAWGLGGINNEHILSGYSEDQNYAIHFLMNYEIKNEYEYHEPSFGYGHYDSTVVTIGGFHHYVVDSLGLAYLSIGEQFGLYYGVFSGIYRDFINGDVIQVSGDFNNVPLE